MNVELKDKLKRYENSFRLAIERGFIESGISKRDIRFLTPIYNELSGENLHIRICRGCDVELFQKLGKLYFEGPRIVAKVESAAATTYLVDNSTPNIVMSDVKEPQKPKRVRVKKQVDEKAIKTAEGGAKAKEAGEALPE